MDGESQNQHMNIAVAKGWFDMGEIFQQYYSTSPLSRTLVIWLTNKWLLVLNLADALIAYLVAV